VNLSSQKKRDLVHEVRGIAREIDEEFERVVTKSTGTVEKIEQVEHHLNNILDLIVMYQNAINSMQT
jgi:hypothetical protein